MVNEISGALEMSAFGPGQIIPSSVRHSLLPFQLQLAPGNFCYILANPWFVICISNNQIDRILNMFQIIKNFYHYVQEILQICPALFFLKLQRQIQQGSWAAPKSGRQPAFGASMQLDRGRRLFFS